MITLDKATSLLKDLNHSCIIMKNNEIIYTSKFIGVKPLLIFMDMNVKLVEGDKLTLIDKVIGRAALLLAVKCNISEIYTPIISEEALSAAEHYGIKCFGDKTVPYIINRQGTDKCPIEKSVTEILNIDDAVWNIKGVIAELMKNK